MDSDSDRNLEVDETSPSRDERRERRAYDERREHDEHLRADLRAAKEEAAEQAELVSHLRAHTLIEQTYLWYDLAGSIEADNVDMSHARSVTKRLVESLAVAGSVNIRALPTGIILGGVFQRIAAIAGIETAVDEGTELTSDDTRAMDRSFRTIHGSDYDTVVSVLTERHRKFVEYLDEQSDTFAPTWLT